MYYVYIYRDPVTKLPFYVGKGTGRRAWRHLYEKYDKSTNKLRWSKIQSIKESGVHPIVEIYEESLTEDQALLVESNLIKQFGKILDNTGTLTNILDGGAQPPKGVGNPEWKTNNPSSTYKGISYEDRYGAQRSNEIKATRSIALKGRQFSEDSIQRMKLAAQSRPKSHYIHKKVHTDDGVFNSMTEAAAHYNISPSSVTNRVKSKRYLNWYYA